MPFRENDEVIFYSDGCGYQNRNCTVANGLYNLALRLLVRKRSHADRMRYDAFHDGKSFEVHRYRHHK